MNAEQAKAYILAGNATFTAKSLATGKHYTFNAKKAKQGYVWFFSVLGGEEYRYVGTLFGQRFVVTDKSTFERESQCVKALQWVLNCIFVWKELINLEVLHDGTCGRCGRQLTHPDSILTGLGPECAKKVA